MKKAAKKKESPMTEKAFLKLIKEAFEHDDVLQLHRRNIVAGNARSGRYVRSGEPGMSDLFGTIKEWTCPCCKRERLGVSVEIEVKGIDKNGRRGKPTAAQEKWLETVRRNNGVALLLHPADDDWIPGRLRARVWRLIERQLCLDCFERR